MVTRLRVKWVLAPVHRRRGPPHGTLHLSTIGPHHRRSYMHPLVLSTGDVVSADVLLLMAVEASPGKGGRRILATRPVAKLLDSSHA